MFRISKSTLDETVTFKFEGTLRGDWVQEADRVCHNAAGKANRTLLDLSELSFVDSAGVGLLRGLINRGAEISACSSFVSEVLQREKRP
ncbi:MAG TPA: STAS domain-containing protein [Phycisphaerae bacterium]|nr:STAS domain-containing protein [Phycisphaerae bacterium]